MDISCADANKEVYCLQGIWTLIMTHSEKWNVPGLWNYFFESLGVMSGVWPTIEKYISFSDANLFIFSIK